jgi:hypothetical protein
MRKILLVWAVLTVQVCLSLIADLGGSTTCKAAATLHLCSEFGPSKWNQLLARMIFRESEAWKLLKHAMGRFQCLYDKFLRHLVMLHGCVEEWEGEGCGR